MLLNTQHRGPPLPSRPTRSRLAQHPGAAVEVPWLRELHKNSKCQTSHQHPGCPGTFRKLFQTICLELDFGGIKHRNGHREGEGWVQGRGAPPRALEKCCHKHQGLYGSIIPSGEQLASTPSPLKHRSWRRKTG